MEIQPPLKQFQDPFLSIIQLRQIGKISAITKNLDLSSIFENNFFPNFSIKQIETIKSIISHNRHIGKADILSAVQYCFPFRPNQLLVIYETAITNFSIKEIELIANIVLFQYISWISYCERVKSLEYIEIILESINFSKDLISNANLSNSNDNNSNANTNASNNNIKNTNDGSNSSNLLYFKDLSNLLSETFLYSIGVYLSYPELKNLEIVMGSVSSFFVKPSINNERSIIVPIQAFSIFPEFLRKLNETNQSPFSFFQSLIFIACHFKSKFPKESINEIMRTLLPYLKKLYLSSIAILGYILDMADFQKIADVLDTLSNAFAEESIKCENLIDIKIMNTINGFSLYVKQKENNELINNEMFLKFFKNEITMQNSNMFDIKSSFWNQRNNDECIFESSTQIQCLTFKEQICAICDVLGEHPKYVSYFMGNMFTILKNSELQINANKYINLFSTVLLMSTKLSMFYQPEKLEVFFTPIIFDTEFDSNVNSISEDTRNKANAFLESMRESAFEILLKEGEKTISEILTLSITKPNLFLRLIRYSYSRFEHFKNIFSDNIVNALSNALLYFKENNVDISFLKSFLSFLFSDKQIINFFNCNERFLRTFLLFIYNASQRDYVFNIIIDSSKFPKSALLASIFSDLISNIIIKSVESEKEIQLLKKIVNFICKFDDLSNIYIIVPSLLKQMSFCVFECLNILLSFSTFYKVNQHEANILSDAIISSPFFNIENRKEFKYREDVYYKIFKTLIQLSAGKRTRLMSMFDSEDLKVLTTIQNGTENISVSSNLINELPANEAANTISSTLNVESGLNCIGLSDLDVYNFNDTANPFSSLSSWDLNYVFIIENENYLYSMLKIFENSLHFLEIIQFLTGLCQMNNENAIKLHCARIDLFIINKIEMISSESRSSDIGKINKENETKFSIKNNLVVQSLIFLFKAISSVSSSWDVVQNLISLLKAKNCFDLIISSINELIMDSFNDGGPSFLFIKAKPLSVFFTNNALVILPLFKMNFEVAFNLLSTILSTSVESELSFHESEGFSHLAYILQEKAEMSDMNTNINTICTKKDSILYLRFFSLFNTFQTKELQNDIFKYVLLNFNLWAEDIINVSQHWLNTLLPSFSTREFRKYNNFLNLAMLFSSQITENETKKKFIEIICEILIKSSDFTDFRLLVSYCLNSNEEIAINFLKVIEHVKSFHSYDPVQLLDNLLCDSPRGSFSSKIRNAEINEKVNYCDHNTTKFMMKYVDVIVKMHFANKIKSISLKSHLTLIIRRINTNLFTKEFLVYLVSLLNRPCIDILPLCCLAAASLGDENIIWLFENISLAKLQSITNKTGSDINNSVGLPKDWAVWPLILAFQTTDELAEKMILNFILRVSPDEWPTILQTTEVVLEIFYHNSPSSYECYLCILNHFKRKIMIEISDLILLKQMKDFNLQIFVKLSKLFLFFIETNNENGFSNSLNLLFSNSIFSGYINDKLYTFNEKKNKKESRRRSSFTLRSKENRKKLLNDLNLENKIKEQNVIRSPNVSKKVNKEDVIDALMKMKIIKIDEIVHSVENAKTICNFNNISLFKDRKLIFSLRIDEEGKWEDIEYSQKCCEVLIFQINSVNMAKNQSQKETSREWLKEKEKNEISMFKLLFIILYFLFRQEKYKYYAVSKLNNLCIEPNVQEKCQSYINLICQVFPISINDSKTNSANIANLSSFSFMKYRLFQENKLFFDSFEKFRECSKTIDLFKMLETGIIDEASKSKIVKSISFFDVDDCLSAIEEARINTEENKKKSYKQWESLYDSLTIEGAPWNFLKKKGTNLAYLNTNKKRSRKLCGKSLIPLVLKNSKPKKTELAGNDIKKNINDKKKMKIKKAIKPIKYDPSPKNPKLKDEKPFIYMIDGKDADSVLYVTFYQSEIAKFKITNSEIILSFDGNNSINHVKSRKVYLILDICEIYLQNFVGMSIALEIIFKNGKSVFVAFASENRRNIALKQINFPVANTLKSNSQTKYSSDAMRELTQKWVKGEIPNFDYLSAINRLACRSFNSPSQYPIFPWTIFDIPYKNNNNNESILQNSGEDQRNNLNRRDLSKCVAEFEPKRLSLLQRIKKDTDDVSPPGHIMSYSMLPLPAVINYLKAFYSYKMPKNRNSKMSRLFSQFKFDSLQNLCDSVFNNVDDYRELIPEFYSMPEMFSKEQLINTNNCSLSLCESSIEFVYLMRKVLESDEVTEDLPFWIDLTFGINQNKGNNIYHRFLYEKAYLSCVEKINKILPKDSGNCYCQLRENRSSGKKCINNDISVSSMLLKKKKTQINEDVYFKSQSNDLKNELKLIRNFSLFRGQIPPQIFYNSHPNQLKKIEDNKEMTNNSTSPGDFYKKMILLFGKQIGDFSIIYAEFLSSNTIIIIAEDIEKKVIKNDGSNKRKKNNNNFYLMNLVIDRNDNTSTLQSSIIINEIDDIDDYGIISNFKKNRNKYRFISILSLFNNHNKYPQVTNEKKNNLNIADYNKYCEINNINNVDYNSVNFDEGKEDEKIIIVEKIIAQRNNWKLSLLKKSGKINIFHMRKYIRSFYIFKRKVKCADISPYFHCGFIGYEDGSILRFSLEDDELMMSFSVVKLSHNKSFNNVSKNEMICEKMKNNDNNNKSKNISKINNNCGNKDDNNNNEQMSPVSSIVSISLHNIIATKSFGFVISFFTKTVNSKETHFISTTTVNGETFREVSVDSRAVLFTTWRDFHGFDFVAFVDHDWRIFVAEVFYLNFKCISEKKSSSDIIALKFSKKMNSLMVITMNGELILYEI